MKSKFFKSSMLLILGGFITKILGFLIKIIYTRIIGEEGISLYSLVIPTYSLLITIATLSMPIVISKIIAEKDTNKKTVVFTSCFIVLFLNLFLILLVLIFSKYISVNLLKEPRTYYLLLSIALTLPFISISSIIKGYFYGKQKMMPHVISNIIEQIVRILLISFILPITIKKGIILTVSLLILFNVISEIVSIIVFLFFLPNKFKIHFKDIKPDLGVTKEILKISIPSVSSRLVGNIGYFFEPILLLSVLTASGLSNDVIIRGYGIYNSYSIALLLMPSFLITAISTALLPEMSKLFAKKDRKKICRRLKQALLSSFFVGIVFSIFILIFRDQLLMTLYKTTSGSDFIKVLAPCFVLFYLEAPLSNFLMAANKPNLCLMNTFFGVLIKLSSMCILGYLGFGIYSLIYAEIINIIFVVSFSLIQTRNILHNL